MREYVFRGKCVMKLLSVSSLFSHVRWLKNFTPASFSQIETILIMKQLYTVESSSYIRSPLIGQKVFSFAAALTVVPMNFSLRNTTRTHLHLIHLHASNGVTLDARPSTLKDAVRYTNAHLHQSHVASSYWEHFSRSLGSTAC